MRVIGYHNKSPQAPIEDTNSRGRYAKKIGSRAFEVRTSWGCMVMLYHKYLLLYVRRYVQLGPCQAHED